MYKTILKHGQFKIIIMHKISFITLSLHYTYNYTHFTHRKITAHMDRVIMYVKELMIGWDIGILSPSTSILCS